MTLEFSLGEAGVHAGLRVAEGRLVDLGGNGCVLGVLETGAQPVAGPHERVEVELPIWFWVQHTKNPRLVAQTFQPRRSLASRSE